MNILVIGSTGASGRAVVEELLERGYRVTAFARNPARVSTEHPNLSIAQGDVMKPPQVSAAVAGHDAVVVTLGITENPLLVRVRGTKRTPLNVRSEGTRNVIEAMHAHGVSRLIVQSTYGVGETRGKLPLKWRLIFSLLLKPQIEDTERQEEIVRASNLAWSLIQPVGLTNSEVPEERMVSADGEILQLAVSRRSVAGAIADSLNEPANVTRSLAVSAA